MAQFDTPQAGARTPGALSVLGTQVIVSGALTDTPIVTTTIGANVPGVNTMLSFRAYGNNDNVATAGAINFWVKNNAGTKVANLSVATPATAGTLKIWRCDFYLTYRAIGTLGTFIIGGDGFSQAPAFGTISFPHLDQTATTAIDTTVAHNWTIGMNWTAALAGNILRADHAEIFLESRL